MILEHIDVRALAGSWDLSQLHLLYLCVRRDNVLQPSPFWHVGAEHVLMVLVIYCVIIGITVLFIGL